MIKSGMNTEGQIVTYFKVLLKHFLRKPTKDFSEYRQYSVRAGVSMTQPNIRCACV